jgi:hypothetical protein
VRGGRGDARLPRLPTLLLIAAPLLQSTSQSTAVWAVVRAVPSAEYATVQAAVDAASDGDVIAIAPGTYAENVRIRGKDLTLQSDFATSGDPADVAATVIEGVPELDDNGTPDDPSDDALVPAAVVEVRAMDSVPGSDPTHVVLLGLTVRGGDSGVNVRPNAHVELLDSAVTGNDDGVELEGRGETDKAFARATVKRCLIEGNGDDGVDVDQRAELWIEDSLVRGNAQDGIEIRLQDNQFAAGESIENVILRNQLLDNGQDGLQLIDYSTATPRAFRVERNVIAGNGASGIGMMCDALTNETFEACPVDERVELVHNTFAGNDHGLTGGANLIGVSNLFVSHASLGVKNVAGASLLEHSLFWSNGVDHEGSTVGVALFEDPLLDADLRPGPGSPAVDAGPATFSTGGGETILDLGCDFHGLAPDLGARELVGAVLASASEAMLQKGPKLKAASKRLDLGSKKSDVIAGLRFEGIGIPLGTTIVAAHLEVVSAKKGTKPAALMIQGEASADAAPLGAAATDLAGRAKTFAFARWNDPFWPEAGLPDQTPDLAAVLQEIVDGPDWEEGNAVTVLFTGTGKRSVDLLDTAPLLHVDFMEPVACVP